MNTSLSLGQTQQDYKKVQLYRRRIYWAQKSKEKCTMIRSGLFSQFDHCYQRTHVGTLAIMPQLSLNKPLSLYLSTVRGLQLNCIQQREWGWAHQEPGACLQASFWPVWLCSSVSQTWWPTWPGQTRALAWHGPALSLWRRPGGTGWPGSAGSTGDRLICRLTMIGKETNQRSEDLSFFFQIFLRQEK